MPKKILNAKIACLDFSLQKIKMKMGVQVLVSDPEKLEGIRARELDITKERIDKIMSTGVNVILSSGGIDDLCLKYFVEAGAMAVRRVKKSDLKRIAKATGASYLTSLTNMEGEESFDATMVGEAAEVVQEMICDDELILIKGPKARYAFLMSNDGHMNNQILYSPSGLLRQSFSEDPTISTAMKWNVQCTMLCVSWNVF